MHCCCIVLVVVAEQRKAVWPAAKSKAGRTFTTVALGEHITRFSDTLHGVSSSAGQGALAGLKEHGLPC